MSQIYHKSKLRNIAISHRNIPTEWINEVKQKWINLSSTISLVDDQQSRETESQSKTRYAKFKSLPFTDKFSTQPKVRLTTNTKTLKQQRKN